MNVVDSALSRDVVEPESARRVLLDAPQMFLSIQLHVLQEVHQLALFRSSHLKRATFAVYSIKTEHSLYFFEFEELIK